MKKDKHLMMRFLVISLVVISTLYGSKFVVAGPTAEHVEWGHWSFNWEVKGNTGLSLNEVFFQGKKILSRASLPVIRVKYVKERGIWNLYGIFSNEEDDRAGGRCGPFQDRITWDHLQPILNCENQMVCVRSYEQENVKWLELGVYARIGEYHIYQSWHLSEDGEMRPLVHSRGLSCHTDHVHHPYWRLDFDIEGNGMDQAFVFDNGTSDEGWGPGWHKYTTERNDHKSPDTDRVWFVRDQQTGHGVWVLPGNGYAPLNGDGVRDGFSELDFAVRRGKPSEDEPWKFGARGELRYHEDQEDVQEQDLVIWYVAHMPHAAVLGNIPWLAAGPTIRIQP